MCVPRELACCRDMMCCICDASFLFAVSFLGAWAGFIMHIVFYCRFLNEYPYWTGDTISGLSYGRWMTSCLSVGMIIFAYLAVMSFTAMYDHSRFDNTYLLGIFHTRGCRQVFCERNCHGALFGILNFAMTVTYMVLLIIGLATMRSKGARGEIADWLTAITCLQCVFLPVGFVSYSCLSWHHPIHDFSSSPSQRLLTTTNRSAV
jgi:hypothetical protein